VAPPAADRPQAAAAPALGAVPVWSAGVGFVPGEASGVVPAGVGFGPGEASGVVPAGVGFVPGEAPGVVPAGAAASQNAALGLDSATHGGGAGR
ncbi:MAG: hypothetical protein LBD97_00145, partial [Bifidobacteriaceae bacterium]|jgi:hypothetical protein|nr:hypothetical protein [Bifidobacteriaceae bacterium]